MKVSLLSVLAKIVEIGPNESSLALFKRKSERKSERKVRVKRGWEPWEEIRGAPGESPAVHSTFSCTKYEKARRENPGLAHSCTDSRRKGARAWRSPGSGRLDSYCILAKINCRRGWASESEREREIGSRAGALINRLLADSTRVESGVMARAPALIERKGERQNAALY